MSAWSKVLPALATLGVLFSAATAWWVTSDVLFFYAVYPLMLVMAVTLLFDKAPLAVSMGVLLALVCAFAALAFAAPILGDGGDVIIPEFPTILQVPLSAGLGIIGMVLVLIARHDEVRPRWLLYGSLFVAWMAFTALFFVPAKDLGSPLTAAALPGLLALALTGLGVRLTMVSRGPPEPVPLVRPPPQG